MDLVNRYSELVDKNNTAVRRAQLGIDVSQEEVLHSIESDIRRAVREYFLCGNRDRSVWQMVRGQIEKTLDAYQGESLIHAYQVTLGDSILSIRFWFKAAGLTYAMRIPLEDTLEWI